jgi:hypothetical protein
MVDNNSGEEKTVLRVRGITLSADVCQNLHFQTMKESVFKYARTTANNNNQEREEGELPMEIDEEEEDFSIATINSHFIQPNVKTGTIITRPMKKYYRPVVTKGVVDGNMIIRDFGAI